MSCPSSPFLGIVSRALTSRLQSARHLSSCLATASVASDEPGRGVKLQHTHVLTDHARGIFLPYAVADAYQNMLRAPFFAWKDCLSVSQSRLDGLCREPNTPDASAAAAASPSTPSPPPQTPPLPQLLTFVSAPTFTLGRRQIASQSVEFLNESSLLHEALTIPGCTEWKHHHMTPLPYQISQDDIGKTAQIAPQTIQTSRGGLTTYHGPGQLVVWPVIDLHSPLHRHYTLRCYARLLEETTRAVLAATYGIATHLDEAEPGVWAGAQAVAPPTHAERKISAMGVHVRRHVTALGVAVNVNVSVAGPVSVNPWARFVPCGLEDRAVTNVAHEMGLSADGRDGVYRDVDNVLDMEALAAAWASEFARRLGLVGVNQVRVDALEMVNRAA